MTRIGRAITDLSLLVVFVVGAAGALLLPGVPWQVEWALGIPFVVAVPGYALVAALFPAGPSTDRAVSGQSEPPGWGARTGMALVASVLVVAVVGVSLSAVGSLRLAPVVLAVGGVTVVGVAVARLRRKRFPLGQRADPVAGVGLRTVPGRLGLSGFQTVSLVVATLALVGALAGVGAAPSPGASFSEATLLSGGDSDERLGANGTVTLATGGANVIDLRLDNHEGERITYGIVGEIQRVAPNGTVLESQRVDDGRVTVADDGSVVVERRIDPSMTGDALRLQYLVYTGPVPEDPRPGTADLSLRHWVTVADGSAT